MLLAATDRGGDPGGYHRVHLGHRTGAGIAVALYPVLRRHNEGLALGAVSFRVVEGVFVLVGAVSLLALLTLGQESVAAGWADPSSLEASGTLLRSVRDWAQNFMGPIPFQLGALMYYCVMYKGKVVPRWLSGWGVVGAGLPLISIIHSGFAQDFGFTTLNNVLSAPIGVQEMVLAVGLIVKGFNRSALAPGGASQG